MSYIDDEHFFMVTDAIANADAAAMLEVAGMVNRNGYDEQDFLEKLIEHFRNFLIIHNLRSSKLIERPEPVKERYQRDALRLTPAAIMAMTDFLMQTQRELKFYAEHQFRFELALLKLIELGRGVWPSPTASADEKKLEPVAPPSAPASAAPFKPERSTRRSKTASSRNLVRPRPALPPVPEPPPLPTKGSASSRPAESKLAASIDLGSWKQAFSNLAATLTSIYRQETGCALRRTLPGRTVARRSRCSNSCAWSGGASSNTSRPKDCRCWYRIFTHPS